MTNNCCWKGAKRNQGKTIGENNSQGNQKITHFKSNQINFSSCLVLGFVKVFRSAKNGIQINFLDISKLTFKSGNCFAKNIY